MAGSSSKEQTKRLALFGHVFQLEFSFSHFTYLAVMLCDLGSRLAAAAGCCVVWRRRDETTHVKPGSSDANFNKFLLENFARRAHTFLMFRCL